MIWQKGLPRRPPSRLRCSLGERTFEAMTITIPDDALGIHLATPEQVRLELAVALFVAQRASVSRGARIAGLPFLEFQRELGRREIPQHYTLEDYEADLRTLEHMKSGDRSQ